MIMFFFHSLAVCIGLQMQLVLGDYGLGGSDFLEELDHLARIGS